MSAGFWSGLARRMLDGLENFALVVANGAIAGHNFWHNDTPSEQFTAHRMTNGTGAATVKGYIYSQGNGVDPHNIGALAQVGDVYNAASGKIYFICVGGGVADGYDDYFVAMVEGAIVEVESDGAVTIDQYVDMPPALGTNGLLTPAAGATIGQTVGMCHTTTGGAGPVNITIGRFWS